MTREEALDKTLDDIRRNVLAKTQEKSRGDDYVLLVSDDGFSVSAPERGYKSFRFDPPHKPCPVCGHDPMGVVSGRSESQILNKWRSEGIDPELFMVYAIATADYTLSTTDQDASPPLRSLNAPHY